MTESEIAKFRQQQTLQEQAAQQALYGVASVATHRSITARMERGAQYLLTLLKAGQYEKVIRLMEAASWGLEEEQCHIMIENSIESTHPAEGASSL